MGYIVVEENSGRIPYNKVYTGEGHAKRAIKSNRATFPNDKLAVVRLDPATVKGLIEEQRQG